MSSDVGGSRFLLQGCHDADVHMSNAEPVTSVQQTRDGNAVLVSTLDSTIRLMDKGNGQLLQSYQGHTNKDYRIRSCLGMADSVLVSGSEDGHLYAWDVLEGKIIQKLKAHGGKVASGVAFNGTKKEWASAGVDGREIGTEIGFDVTVLRSTQVP